MESPDGTKPDAGSSAAAGGLSLAGAALEQLISADCRLKPVSKICLHLRTVFGRGSSSAAGVGSILADDCAAEPPAPGAGGSARLDSTAGLCGSGVGGALRCGPVARLVEVFADGGGANRQSGVECDVGCGVDSGVDGQVEWPVDSGEVEVEVGVGGVLHSAGVLPVAGGPSARAAALPGEVVDEPVDEPCGESPAEAPVDAERWPTYKAG